MEDTQTAGTGSPGHVPTDVADNEVRFGLMLATLTVSFVISGIAQPWAQAVSIGLTGVLLVIGFRNAGIASARPALIALCIVVLSATLLVALLRDESRWRAVPMLLESAVLAVLVVLAVRAALHRSDVDLQTILAAISAYVLIGFVYAWGYLALDIIDDDQFSIPASESTEYFSFSFVVQTTLGFGNQVPTSSISSRLVVTQAVVGQIFLATLVARLVSMYGTKARRGQS
ncbi:MAG: hypothetical protein WBP59_02190 [Ilumatobacteraceae bacterium]